jgi:Nif-specific ferredoxin III
LANTLKWQKSKPGFYTNTRLLKGKIMAFLTGKTRAGTDWVPEFVTAIDKAKCIGCGRCYKACPRDVLTLVEYQVDEDEDIDSQAMVMDIVNEGDCIGCASCSRVCPKDCYSHEPIPA